MKRYVRCFLSERHDFLGFLCRQAPHKDSCKLGFSLIYIFSKPSVLRFTEKTISPLVKRLVICSRAEIFRNKGILKSLAHKTHWLNSKLCRRVRCETHYIC